MNIYAENILEHFRNPRNCGEMQGATVDHREENIECGDDLQLFLKIEDGKIEDVKWGGKGCAISQASMSILSEELIGMSEIHAEKMTKEDIYELLGVPIGPRRFKCALIGFHTLQNALLKAHGKYLQSWVKTMDN
ncbi:iron-sulfur cluster assembly scaffold protein [Candidatus Peribacteria bacterium]|jgi:nitrogen fixation protein NifU and related proteins|nr:iron-sulfur cluster assembly scaffold protein [Candidatus Peribacteria bacterium]MBT4020865.1 iron-sulfur cluster assembly scaffold protein [Candidatus Peribacteria bacterium]MBT4241154.1 iron-sulfur cluster assembly scaffold protein [Candidatus Peribacteria bacterium]MBT4473876.1 iron-sulfur cluster assembly scaffold protein [Candidatus Peribacteria bacterium]